MSNIFLGFNKWECLYFLLTKERKEKTLIFQYLENSWIFWNKTKKIKTDLKRDWFLKVEKFQIWEWWLMVVLWKNNADNSHWLFWIHFSAWCFNQLCLERTSDTQLSQPAHGQIALQWLIQQKGGILHIFTVEEEAKQTSTPALPGLHKDLRCCQSPILPAPGRGRRLPVDLVVPGTGLPLPSPAAESSLGRVFRRLQPVLQCWQLAWSRGV